MELRYCECCERDLPHWHVPYTTRNGIDYCQDCQDTGCDLQAPCDYRRAHGATPCFKGKHTWDPVHGWCMECGVGGRLPKRTLRAPKQCKSYGHVLDALGYCRNCGWSKYQRPTYVGNAQVLDGPSEREIEAAIASIRTSVPDAPPAKS